MPKGVYVHKKPGKCLEGCTCWKHRPMSEEHRKIISKVNLGRYCELNCNCGKHQRNIREKRTEESKRKMSLARIRYFEENPEARLKISQQVRDYLNSNPMARKLLIEQGMRGINTILNNRKRTTIEDILYKILCEEYPNETIVYQYHFGYFYFDFAIPEKKLLFEADGSYWHKNTKRDKRKNTFSKNKGWKLIRYSEEVLRNWIKNNKSILMYPRFGQA